MAFIAPPVKPIMSPAVETKPIHTLVNIFEGERSMYTNPPLSERIMNKDLKTVYVFEHHPDLDGATGNLVWSLGELLDTGMSKPQYKLLREFDTFGAAAIGLISFSSDNHYLAFRTRANMGSALYGFILETFDLKDGKMIGIEPPDRLMPNWNRQEFGFLESYEFKDFGVIDMIWYTVKMEYDFKTHAPSYYRVSKRELWQYDLSTKQYTFLKNLDE